MKPTDQPRPAHAEGVPAEEGMEEADVAERADVDPEEQPNRPEQDMPEWERRQYEDPPLEQPLADSDVPEDR